MVSSSRHYLADQATASSSRSYPSPLCLFQKYFLCCCFSLFFAGHQECSLKLAVGSLQLSRVFEDAGRYFRACRVSCRCARSKNLRIYSSTPHCEPPPLQGALPSVAQEPRLLFFVPCVGPLSVSVPLLHYTRRNGKEFQ